MAHACASQSVIHGGQSSKPVVHPTDWRLCPAPLHRGNVAPSIGEEYAFADMCPLDDTELLPTWVHWGTQVRYQVRQVR